MPLEKVSGDPFAPVPVKGDPFAERVGPLADVAMSAGTGLRRAATTVADAVGGWKTKALLDGVDASLKLGGLITGRDTAPARASVNAIRAKTKLQSTPDHVPQTTAGRYALTGAEMLPNAVLSPGRAVAKTAAVLLPTIGAQGAADVAAASAHPEWEDGAKIAGGIVGGLATAPFIGNALRSRVVSDPVTMAANAVRSRTKLADVRAKGGAQLAAGAEPTFVSASGSSMRGLVRAAASRSETSRDLVQQRADASALNLPDRISRQARGHITDDGRAVPAVEADIGDFIRNTATPPEVSPGYAGMVTSQKLNAGRDRAWDEVNAAYREARELGPTGAHLPMAERPRIAADLREAVAGYAAENVPRVTNVLKTLDNTGTLTADDMFNMRTQLTNLRVSGDPVEASAAAKAVSRLDQIIDDAHDSGLFTGNADVVGAYKLANTKRRAFGQNYEGEDMIQALTDRKWRGDGGKQVAIAPEDAGFAIFGRGQGVSNRPNLTRDLLTMRNRLGPESAEWTAIQQEGLGRILGRDTGAENYGASLDAFRRANPELAEVLVSPQQWAQVRQAQGDIRGAVLDQNAIRLGKNFTAPGSADAFTRDAATMTPERNALARLSAVRDVEVKAGENVSAAPGLARKLAFAPEQQTRNRALLGDEGATRFQGSMAAEHETNAALQQSAPGTGSQTQLRQADQGKLDTVLDGARDIGKLTTGGPMGWLEVLANRAKSFGLNDEQAEALADVATDAAKFEAMLAKVADQPNGAQWVDEIKRLVDNTRRGLPFTPALAIASGSAGRP